MSKRYYIGLMSGTSMDGVDAALVTFNEGVPALIAHYTETIPASLLTKLRTLCLPGNNEINCLGHVDRAVGKLFAQAVNGLLAKANIDSSEVVAIGSHGQTIRHMPNLEMGFTLQIGDPNTIAVETGIDVIADFRRKDVALGGQGAPLVPAFHQHAFACHAQQRIILNIGGIANITHLPGNSHAVTGFDTGPGNGLMDAWIQSQQNQNYDEDGAWAKSGHSDKHMLQQMLSHPYFALKAPKSTGRELFNQAWLSQQLNEFNHLSDACIQSTLLDLTCYSIANDISALSPNAQVFVCGGGAYNSELMHRLQALLPQHTITTSAELGIDPQWVEAVAFAWLAMRHHLGLSGNLPAVTGASTEAVLGGRFSAS